MSLWGAREQPRTLGHIPLLFSSLEWASSSFFFFFLLVIHVRLSGGSLLPRSPSFPLQNYIPLYHPELRSTTRRLSLPRCCLGKRLGWALSILPSYTDMESQPLTVRTVCVCVWGLISATQREQALGARDASQHHEDAHIMLDYDEIHDKKIFRKHSAECFKNKILNYTMYLFIKMY